MGGKNRHGAYADPSEISRLLFLLDFDGTLSPIVENPEDAYLPDRVKGWIKGLSEDKNCKIAIVTGRALRDIRARVGLENIIYASNHGMEVYYRGRLLLRKGDIYRRPLKSLGKKLGEELSGIPDVYLENKGLSLAVHLRRVDKRHRRSAVKTVRAVVGPWLRRYKLRLTGGKMLLEVRPLLWDKGKAVLWIWKRFAPKCLPVYVGDDVTDEDAFLALRPYGITIRIGKKKKSYAEHHCPSIERLIDSTMPGGTGFIAGMKGFQ